LYLNANSQAEFKYRNFEKGEVLLTSDQVVSSDTTIEVVFDYDGGGWARGGQFSLIANGKTLAKDRIRLTPPAYFSIDETFDVGIDTGSAAGNYPADQQSYPFAGGNIESVVITLK
jgi:arylsulfatase